MRGGIRIAIACTGLLLVAAAGARAQTTFHETGSVTVGGYVLWVRGTNAKVVELFVGRGFRDAFARAHEMDAAKLQQWIDSVRAVTPLAGDDSSSMDAPLRGAALGLDVTMMRRVGGTFSGLRLLVAGEDPVTMAEPTARDFIAMLDSAARVTRELSVPPPTIMASMPMQIAAPSADAPSATRVVTTVASTVAATPAPAPTHASAPPRVPAPVHASVPAPVHASVPAPVHASQTAPVRAAAPASVSAPDIPAVTASVPASTAASAPTSRPVGSMGPSTADAPPELVLPAPSQPMAPLGNPVDVSRLPTPVIPPPARARIVEKSAAPVAAPAPALAVAPVAAPVAAPATVPAIAAPAVAPPAVTAPPTAPPAPARDPVVPPHVDAPSDKLIRTPLGPFTIPGALLSDRDKQAQYCYTQLGLKYSPDLKGEITVKLSVGSDGAVQDAVVTKRNWQGISAGEVESCVRALAHDWTFVSTDPSITGGAKLLTFSFAP